MAHSRSFVTVPVQSPMGSSIGAATEEITGPNHLLDLP